MYFTQAGTSKRLPTARLQRLSIPQKKIQFQTDFITTADLLLILGHIDGNLYSEQRQLRERT